jgi:hypothetical protein
MLPEVSTLHSSTSTAAASSVTPGSGFFGAKATREGRKVV